MAQPKNLAVLFTTLAALGPALASQAAQSDECLRNYAVKGSALSGKTHTTHGMLEGVAPTDALPRIARFLSLSGFTVLSQNPGAGLIEAAQSAMLAQGKRLPLNVAVTAQGNGSQVNTSFVTSPLMIFSTETLKDHLCKTIAAGAAGDGASPTPTPTAAAMPANPAPPPARPRIQGVAMLSPSQAEQIATALRKGPHPERLSEALPALLPTLAQFVERMACISTFSAVSTLDEFAAAGVSFRTKVIQAPMPKMKYHDSNQCLDVLRVQGWTMPADNALQFEVAYKAADSGEVAKSSHEVVRQPDGSWLFRR
ncbi:hypothetical protein [Inhella proteolytica]|uniref:Uncharacterized protein n=1 Tax=Inhella proteolytica TaxID=2795029 RepID=A0A931J5W6_9BURK|nr:hypothetical protein [Inhella proteolytica]MBH9576892.1 hypothetical protein [Inhella proteolytica]